MSNLSTTLTTSIWSALGGGAENVRTATFTGDGALSSTFAVTDLVSASIAAAALAIAELVARRGGRLPAVRVDRRLSSFWCALSLRPLGWALPAGSALHCGGHRTDG